MKPLFSTFCAAAIIAAQPAFSDQSQGILGTWDCEFASGFTTGTTQFTFFADGTGYNNWDTTTVESGGQVRRTTDSEITWYIDDGFLHHHHTHSTLRKLHLNGNDHTHSALGKSIWSPPTHTNGDPMQILILTADTLEIGRGPNTNRVRCTRYLAS